MFWGLFGAWEFRALGSRHLFRTFSPFQSWQPSQTWACASAWKSGFRRFNKAHVGGFMVFGLACRAEVF